ncbi:hypothetical protein, variant 2 [Puccinia triticina 1-1 BBBD Race 1]|uniref:Uncharacterized protein n=1 Tax=Puccinia triticina (isolate 1-1 / race 1 (BBBD)) TaxID=630390 RepID=A0A180H0H0_PUCT1|nr:hypothetical protein PTTG_01811 [Puccinia triticina 1-1 BBBD Race 1]OAV98557.1 hypothetical protein, variant 1 [Puccinia triticina 1-1 BBBD Race 1]OAV98558.1 hypothetical protein, variant 2 [Puccinia triticina 1-1 BBBD Race 1]
MAPAHDEDEIVVLFEQKSRQKSRKVLRASPEIQVYPHRPTKEIRHLQTDMKPVNQITISVAIKKLNVHRRFVYLSNESRCLTGSWRPPSASACSSPDFNSKLLILKLDSVEGLQFQGLQSLPPFLPKAIQPSQLIKVAVIRSYAGVGRRSHNERDKEAVAFKLKIIYKLHGRKDVASGSGRQGSQHSKASRKSVSHSKAARGGQDEDIIVISSDEDKGPRQSARNAKTSSTGVGDKNPEKDIKMDIDELKPKSDEESTQILYEIKCLLNLNPVDSHRDTPQALKIEEDSNVLDMRPENPKQEERLSDLDEGQISDSDEITTQFKDITKLIMFLREDERHFGLINCNDIDQTDHVSEHPIEERPRDSTALTDAPNPMVNASASRIPSQTNAADENGSQQSLNKDTGSGNQALQSEPLPSDRMDVDHSNPGDSLSRTIGSLAVSRGKSLIGSENVEEESDDLEYLFKETFDESTTPPFEELDPIPCIPSTNNNPGPSPDLPDRFEATTTPPVDQPAQSVTRESNPSLRNDFGLEKTELERALEEVNARHAFFNDNNPFHSNMSLSNDFLMDDPNPIVSSLDQIARDVPQPAVDLQVNPSSTTPSPSPSPEIQDNRRGSSSTPAPDAEQPIGMAAGMSVDSPVQADPPIDHPIRDDFPVDSPDTGSGPTDIPVPAGIPVGTPVSTATPADIPVPGAMPSDIPVSGATPTDIPVPAERPADIPVPAERPADGRVQPEKPGDRRISAKGWTARRGAAKRSAGSRLPAKKPADDPAAADMPDIPVTVGQSEDTTSRAGDNSSEEADTDPRWKLSKGRAPRVDDSSSEEADTTPMRKPSKGRASRVGDSSSEADANPSRKSSKGRAKLESDRKNKAYGPRRKKGSKVKRDDDYSAMSSEPESSEDASDSASQRSRPPKLKADVPGKDSSGRTEPLSYDELNSQTTALEIYLEQLKRKTQGTINRLKAEAKLLKETTVKKSIACRQLKLRLENKDDKILQLTQDIPLEYYAIQQQLEDTLKTGLINHLRTLLTQITQNDNRIQILLMEREIHAEMRPELEDQANGLEAAVRRLQLYPNM